MAEPAAVSVPPLPSRQPGLLDHPLALWPSAGVLMVLIALPALLTVLGQDFYVSVASRILIFALAASSLNLVLGFGGMVSFGHAAFVGAGAYTVGILM
ncbi:MAG: branched-chain amino acid ABC transporter permease, partial [Rhodoferax sp.]|nr:branched-chain amino acid ABC transporter permease [Rhodoferax sp.]